MMREIAVVGSGYWGKNLTRNFYELGVLGWICDNNPQTLKRFEKKYTDISTVPSYEDILNNPEVAAVAIATPAEQHFTMTKEALKNGKDVYVEKPLAMSVEEGKILRDLAHDKDRILMVGHILKYHPAIVKIKKMLNEKRLGKLYHIYSNRLNLGKVRQEENILWSFAPHDISVILYLLDDQPEIVNAMGGTYLQPNIYDVTLTTLKFRSGVMAHIYVSWLHPFKEHRLVIIGDKKMLVFEDSLSENKLKLYDKGIDWIDGEPVPRNRDFEVIDFPSDEPLKIECQHFCDCITTRRTPKSDGQDGVNVLSVLSQSEDSLLQNEINYRGNRKYEWEPISNNDFYVHPTAVIDQPCRIGKGSKIWHFSHVMENSEIGENCNLGQNVFIANNVEIGNNVKIQNNVSVYEGVILEDHVFCGPSMVFTNVKDPRSEFPQVGSEHYLKTLVRKSASIGANATIVCGNNIGKYAFIGAGAVVTKDIPDYAVVTGVPGRIVGWICECGKERLDFGKKLNETKCKNCNRNYRIKDGTKVVKLDV